MKKIALIFVLILALTGNAYASDNEFKKADINRDGNIDQKEFDAAVANKFRQYDKNSNGVIDSKEFNAPKDFNAGREFNFMDRNKDGNVTIDEFRAAAAERFKLYDENKDRILSSPEYQGDRAYPILKFYF